MEHIWTCILVAIAVFLFHRYHVRKRTLPSLPPGPRGLPLVGNIRDLPPKTFYDSRHWVKHKNVYGPISSVTFMGQTAIIIHDYRIAVDLLGKASLDNAGRPHTELSKASGFACLILNRQYDSVSRAAQKLIRQQFGSKESVASQHEVIEAEIKRFLLMALNEPSKLHDHVRTFAASLILNITYGYSTGSNADDPAIRLLRKFMAYLCPINEVQKLAVDFIPILKYLPRGFPGVAYKEKAERSKRSIEELKNTTLSFVLNRMRVGVFRPSFVSARVQQHNKHEGGSQEYRLSSEEEDAINAIAPSILGGGSDTMIFVLKGFVLAMMKSPEVQRKAQEEIDQIIGNNRFPSVNDRAVLPYVNSLVKECLRWASPAAISPPHLMQQDTTYNGYYVPKGAAVAANTWWLLHDPDIYQDPDEFKPERFLKLLSEPDPETAVFGYGRRACPGKLWAESVLFACISHTLSAFNIAKAVDEQGVELDVKFETLVTQGLVQHMADFPCKITPRDANKAELLRRFEADQPQEESDAYHLEGPYVA